MRGSTPTLALPPDLLLDTCRFSNTVRAPDPSPLASEMARMVRSAVDERTTYANRDTDSLALGSHRSTNGPDHCILLSGIRWETYYHGAFT
jgi:hypothetical protein